MLFESGRARAADVPQPCGIIGGGMIAPPVPVRTADVLGVGFVRTCVRVLLTRSDVRAAIGFVVLQRCNGTRARARFHVGSGRNGGGGSSSRLPVSSPP